MIHCLHYVQEGGAVIPGYTVAGPLAHNVTRVISAMTGESNESIPSVQQERIPIVAPIRYLQFDFQNGIICTCAVVSKESMRELSSR